MPKIEQTAFYSSVLERHVHVQVTGDEGYPLLIFPTSLGPFTQGHDFKLNQTLEPLVESGKLKLYNIETLDHLTFYHKRIEAQERILNYQRYTEFLTTEYIPYLQTLHKIPRIAVAGVSFGGYHCANLTFRKPNLISHSFILSGQFSIRQFMEGLDCDLIYFHSPEEFVSNDSAWKYQHLNLVLSTSEKDICKEATLRMAEVLRTKGIEFWYDEVPAFSHDWPLWRDRLVHYAKTYFG